jgi:putative oxidoreductase
MAASLTSWSPHVLSLLRVASGAAFLAHGTQKWLNFPPRSFAAPEVMSLSGASGAIELIGGALLVLGLFTRPAAFICSGAMAVGYFIAHAPQSFFPVLNQGDAALLYSFVFFYLVFAGPGPWSLDAIIRSKR